MIVSCEQCGKIYDDTYRLTYCPHEGFAMCTLVTRGDGESKVCTSVEDMQAFLAMDGQDT